MALLPDATGVDFLYDARKRRGADYHHAVPPRRQFHFHVPASGIHGGHGYVRSTVRQQPVKLVASETASGNRQTIVAGVQLEVRRWRRVESGPRLIATWNSDDRISDHLTQLSVE